MLIPSVGCFLSAAVWHQSVQNMLLLKLVIFTLTLSKYIHGSDGVGICPKGQRVALNPKDGCKPCPDGSYQPKENRSQQCKPCTNCEENRGSFIKNECTKETDRKCQCREGFVPLESDASTCKCDPGFGLKDGECLKCEDGYFNNLINSPCRKWKVCDSGVNITGSRTSDVLCNDLRTDSYITKNFITQLTSKRPVEETQTKTRRTMATTTAPSQNRVTITKNEPTSPSNTGNYIGLALLMFGIIGLLILTALTCKLHITPCVLRKTAVQTKDSCRRPVEESGNSLSSLKLNTEEP